MVEQWDSGGQVVEKWNNDSGTVIVEKWNSDGGTLEQ